jgi:hypothetical protein
VFVEVSEFFALLLSYPFPGFSVDSLLRAQDEAVLTLSIFFLSVSLLIHLRLFMFHRWLYWMCMGRMDSVIAVALRSLNRGVKHLSITCILSFGSIYQSVVVDYGVYTTKK